MSIAMMSPSARIIGSRSSTSASAAAACVTVAPGKDGYVPPGACNDILFYVPSIQLAVAFCALFGAMLIIHAVMGIVYRRVMNSAAALQTLKTT